MTRQDKIAKLAEIYRPDLDIQLHEPEGEESFFTQKALNLKMFPDGRMWCDWNPFENWSDLMPLVVKEGLVINYYIPEFSFESEHWYCESYDKNFKMFKIHGKDEDVSEKSFRRVACLALIKKAYPEETI